MIENLIFDLDGTLVDSFADIYEAHRATAIDLGRPEPSEAKVRGLMHLRLDQMVQVIFPGIDPEEVMRLYRSHYDRSGYPKTVPYPGVVEGLRTLHSRGHRIFVATNKRRAAALPIIARLDVEKVIGMVVTSDITEPMLDKSGQVRYIMQRNGLGPERTALVGDTRGDWQAASDNGVLFILTTYGYGDIRQDEVDAPGIRSVSSFAQLMGL